jgi:hypothetical protein
MLLLLVLSATTASVPRVEAIDLEPAVRDALVSPVIQAVRDRGQPLEQIQIALIGGITRASIEVRWRERTATVEVPLNAAERSPGWAKELVDRVLGIAIAPAPPERKLRAAGWVSLGVVLAAGSTAVIAGGVVLDAELDLRSEPRFDDAVDPITMRLDAARTVSLISLGIGAAGLIALGLLTWLD